MDLAPYVERIKAALDQGCNVSIRITPAIDAASLRMRGCLWFDSVPAGSGGLESTHMNLREIERTLSKLNATTGGDPSPSAAPIDGSGQPR
jgi:hypothetical protein